MQICFNWIWQCFLLLCLPVEMSIWLHWTCDCISKACVDLLHWPVPKYIFLSILILFWALFCWRFKTQHYRDLRISECSHKIPCLACLSSPALLICSLWRPGKGTWPACFMYLCLDSGGFFVFLSKSGVCHSLLFMSAQTCICEVFEILCVTLVCVKGQRRAGIHSQVCGGDASVHLIACLAYLSKGESWLFSELLSTFRKP